MTGDDEQPVSAEPRRDPLRPQREPDSELERWIAEGERVFDSLEELFAYIDRCPAPGAAPR